MAHSVQVQLPQHSYFVHIGEQVLDLLPEMVEQCALSKRVAVLIDQAVLELHEALVKSALEAAQLNYDLLPIASGEQSKSMQIAQELCEQMATLGHDRSSWVLACGGGVVGDLAGFVAAIYYRGIAFAQVPTTVLAQVDSSVGGKTGVNLSSGKNLAGAFHQPRFVLADRRFLATLPKELFAEGFAEVIKHAVIADRSLLGRLDGLSAQSPELTGVLARNVEIKARIVEADEMERSGLRALLNFGHTFGHALEAAAGYGQMLHGHAVAIGMRAALRLSEIALALPSAQVAEVQRVLKAFDLPQSVSGDDARFGTQRLLELMGRDKKFNSGKRRYVLTGELGSAQVVDDVPENQVRAALETLYEK